MTLGLEYVRRYNKKLYWDKKKISHNILEITYCYVSTNHLYVYVFAYHMYLHSKYVIHNINNSVHGEN